MIKRVIDPNVLQKHKYQPQMIHFEYFDYAHSPVGTQVHRRLQRAVHVQLK